MDGLRVLIDEVTQSLVILQQLGFIDHSLLTHLNICFEGNFNSHILDKDLKVSDTFRTNLLSFTYIFWDFNAHDTIVNEFEVNFSKGVIRLRTLIDFHW